MKSNTELHTEAIVVVGAQFLHTRIAAVPNKLYTVLTDNGMQFTKG
jgi:hypothetical protein